MADSNCIEYRELPNFPGYLVGSDGSVYRRLKTPPNLKGYPRLNLFDRLRAKIQARLHSVVCEAFHGPRPVGMECRHLNGIKTDCRADNLVWGTREQNRQDNHDNGAYMKGSAHTQAKLTEEQVAEIRKRCSEGEPQKRLAAEFGVSDSNISFIINGKSWSHI